MRLDYDVDGLEAILALEEAAAWNSEALTAVFRAAPGPGEFPAINAAGAAVVWTPPEPALVRAVSAVADPADPLVISGGAPTTVSCGLEHGGSDSPTLYIAAITLALWNTAGGRIFGWGQNGPQGASAASTVFQGDATMFPANALGVVHPARSLCFYSDAGTVVGTIRLRWQWRAF